VSSFIQLIKYFIESPRPIKRVLTLCFDSFSIPVCIGLAIWAEFGNDFVWRQKDFAVAILTVGFSLLIFIRFGFYRAILRYIGTTAVSVLLIGISLSTLVYSFLYWVFNSSFSISQTLFYWAFLTVSIGGSRLGFKAYIQRIHKVASRVAIYGAGAAGRQLASALRHGDKYKPVVFLDDDMTLDGAEIEGLTVISPLDLERAIVKYGLSHVFLALPSASHATRGEILRRLEPYPLTVKTTAGMEDIVSGKVKIEELKELDIEDLLGRDPVIPDETLLKQCIHNKVVMVTGAGGSIGAELCRQILYLKPSKLLLYELSEYALYLVERDLKKIVKERELDVEVLAFLGSVQHKKRLTRCMQAMKVQTVYHAAAYKHVPIVEHNIVEGIRNNVMGTFHCAQAALEARIEKFVLISTDKAVRPTNIMGASKRLAELVLQALSEKSSSTVFTMVRFGNVLGSSGSVVPLFREQVKSGGPVTVTHPDIIRYFMTIPEAAQLVIQAGAMGQGGDVFVLDMGEPVRIAALAERMIHLMGRTVKSRDEKTGDIEIEYSGLRPGEKLYEELLIGENVEGTEHKRIMTANEASLSWEDMKTVLKRLDQLCDSMDCNEIVQLLLNLPLEYNPQHDVCDLLLEEVHVGDDKVIQFNTLS